MTPKKFDWKRFSLLTKKRFKKKFKKPIKAREIKKIWENFVQYGIIDKVILGGVVQIDKNSTIEIVGRSVMEDKRMVSMLSKGKSLRRNGTFKTAEMNPRRKDIIYKLVYTHKLGKVNFKAHPKFSKQVHHAIVHKNHYYRIDDK